MQAVFLDFDTLGPADIDPGPLRRHLPGLKLFGVSEENEIAARSAGANVVIVNKVRLNERTLGGAGELKLICLAATGTDNVDLEFARRNGIAVCNIRDYCTPSVVQHVFALILALTHRLRAYESLVANGRWQSHTQFCMLDQPIRELAGRTLGIVGLGTLGRGVAEIGRAFGMRVIAAARSHRGDSVEPAGINRVPFDRLLADSDVVSLHCPLTETTHHLVDSRALASMRREALLINTARGGLVDSRALVEALVDGRIGGAGIDVLEEEPPVSGDPLLDARLPNLIVTPHIAWAAAESRQRAVNEIAANVAAFLAGERRNRVV